MKGTSKQFGRLLFELTERKEREEIEENLKKFVLLLATHRMVSKLSQIIKEYQRQYDQRYKIISVSLKSACEISDSVRKMLKQKIAEVAEFEEIELCTEIDPKLLGGVRLEWDGSIFDATLLQQLKNLKEKVVRI